MAKKKKRFKTTPEQMKDYHVIGKESSGAKIYAKKSRLNPISSVPVVKPTPEEYIQNKLREKKAKKKT